MTLPTRFKETALERFDEARRFWNNWRGEARDDFDFIAGKQWLDDDKALLDEQKRPPITFNYSEKMIDAVVGAEVSNRQEVIYKPRAMDDVGSAELMSNAVKWVRDEANIEDEDTDAFRDCLICGLGWTHTRVSYETDPEGMIETNRKDPLSMYPDPAARKSGLIDRRYSFCSEWVDERDAKRQWPNAVSFVTLEETAGNGVVRKGHEYEDTNDDPDNHKGQVQVLHYECVENEPFYRVAIQDQIEVLTPSDFAKVKDQLDTLGIPYVKLTKKVYYYAYFAGETLLESGKSPCQTGFTYNCITGKRDRNKNTWYGLTRVMKDPQRWANKWLSQILHIINSNAKGGLLAEANAFIDPVRAQDEWAQPDSITLLKEGGINKIKEKSMAAFPSGLDRLMEFALGSLPQVTGINLEALGLAGREQANVLEQSRKQAAYGLLAPVFDSLRRYRKEHGRVLLYFINTYISDGRLIRVGGADAQQFIPLTKAPGFANLDVIVEQAPDAPDVKEKTWQALVQLIPAMLKAGTPIPPDVIDYTPIPAALAQKWKQFAAQSQPSMEQMRQMQQEMQKLQQENQQAKSALRDKGAELQLKQQETMASLAMEKEKMVLEFQLERAKMLEEFQLERAKLLNEMTIMREKQSAEAEMAREKQSHERDLKQQEVSGNIDARMIEVINAGANEASANIMKAVNELIGTIGKLTAESEADKD